MDSGIERLAKTFKVLGDYNRLGIVMIISKVSRAITDVINATGMSQMNRRLIPLPNLEVSFNDRPGDVVLDFGCGGGFDLFVAGSLEAWSQ